MIAPPANEKDLVILLTQDDEVAFERLYNFYSGRLLGYLLKFVKSETLAGEILQDSFVKIWNSRHHIDPDQSFPAYLFRIAENLVYDFFRKAARDKKLQKELIDISSVQCNDVEEALCSKENVRLLQLVIDALPPKRRQVFQLIKIEERSYEEVSGLLNISASTISDHIVKATKFVREKLEDYHINAIIILAFFHLL